jgi:hypothetical protein
VPRLTLMIGWWGEEAAELGGGRRSHAPGPQSSVPRASAQLTWPGSLGNGREACDGPPCVASPQGITRVCPVWEAVGPPPQVRLCLMIIARKLTIVSVFDGDALRCLGFKHTVFGGPWCVTSHPGQIACAPRGRLWVRPRS